MNANKQSAAILFSTLIMGVILGMLGAGAMAQRRTGRISSMREGGSFVQNMEQIIVATDEAQRSAIRTG